MNPAELEYIRGLDDKGRLNQVATGKARPKVPWSTLLLSPNMWAIMCAYFTYVYCLYIFLAWLPSYLVGARHLTPEEARLLTSLPLSAMVVGNTVGGLATDWLLHKTGNTRFARRSVAIVGMLGCAAFILLAALVEDAHAAVYCLTGAAFFLECTIGPSWSVPMDTAGEYSGTVSGMMNMAGNFGGALSPVVFGYLAQYWLLARAVLRRRSPARARRRRVGLLARSRALGGREARGGGRNAGSGGLREEVRRRTTDQPLVLRRPSCAPHTALNRSTAVVSTSSPGRLHQSSEKISTSWMPR